MRKLFTSKNIIVFFSVLGFLFAVSFLVKDKDAILEALAGMKYSALLLVLLFTTLSYLLMNIAFASSAILLGVEMPFKKLFYLGFISSVIANLISIAGITSYTTKVALFKKHNLRVSQITAFTFFFANLGNITLLALLPFGIKSFLSVQSIAAKITFSAQLEIFSVIFLALAVNLAIFIGPFRRVVLGILLKFVRKGQTREAFEARILAVNEAMDRTLLALKENPGKLVKLAILSCLSWLFAILALGACFYSLGIAMPFGVLITGFTIGIFIGVVSVIPGGMGIQEATMAGVFSFLGINFGVAVLAAIIFRLIYYVIPFFLGLALSKRWNGAE